MVQIRYCFIFILLFIYPSISLLGQSIVTEFGKNRVQYHNDQYNWSRYETENFVTYWYGKSRNIAQATIQLAELDHSEIQKLLEHTLSDKIEIIVYIDLSDMKQSNIGNQDAFTNKNGQTTVESNKILVYFDGDHQNLRSQIRKGIATVYMNSILYGTSLQEIVQNALLLNLPTWFIEGIINYADSPWDTNIEDELRDLLAHKSKFKKFDKLAREHPRVAGHSLWNYIANTFGASTIANIIYLTRISRSLDNSFLFVLGVELEIIKKNWYNYYRKSFESEENKFTATAELEKLNLKNKKGVPISQFRYSKDNKYLAYSTNDRSKVKVFVKDLESGKTKKVHQYDSKNLFQESDYAYPLMCWHPQYPELTIIFEKRDILKIKKVDIKQGKVEIEDMTSNFQRIYSIDQITLHEYLLSASTDGYSDLYLYDADKRHHTRITEDFYDDLEASVMTYKGTRGILFRSNRLEPELKKEKLDTIIPISNFDLYFLSGMEKDAELIALTQTKNINEKNVFPLEGEKITYLSNESGINNIYIHDLKSNAKSNLTNLERNVILHHPSPDRSKHIFSYYYKGNYDNFALTSTSSMLSPYKTKLSKELESKSQDVVVPFLPKEEKENPGYSEGMKFQSEFPDPEDLKPIEENLTKTATPSLFDKYFKDYFSESYIEGKRVVKFNPMRASASRERFRLNNFITKMDNTVLFEGLESYTGNDKELNATPLGLLLKGQVIDLLENYEINVGLRIPTRFNGYEFFVVLDDNKKLWDKRLALYRQTENQISNPNIVPAEREKRNAFLGMYRLKYPFDVYRSLRLTTSLRLDRYINLSTDIPTFEAPAFNEKRLSLKAEYVYDNSHTIAVNILNGSRMKFFVEGINEFDLTIQDQVEFDLSTALTGIIGFDARHYIPILDLAVLAIRGTGATSFGNKRVVYYLGGMESWLFSSSEVDIPVPENSTSAFKVNAPHLRGFRNNIRNGNTYLLSNFELRFPIFQMLGLTKSRFAFIRNMQISSFFDAGLAWYGSNPNDEVNTLNTVNVSNPIDNPVITIDARYFRDPLVYGYGFGLRSTMLGYFVKFDYAWGVETGQKRDPRIYFSLGLDF